MAGESSSGTFVRLPGETDALRERFRARVESVEELASVPSASLPTRGTHGGPFRRARIVVSWPLENTGVDLPTVLVAVAGNISELEQLSGVRLLDLDLPKAFAARIPARVRHRGHAPDRRRRTAGR